LPARTLNLDQASFLARYWQRRALLVRDAVPGFRSPLTPDELAGLALEEEVESRIVDERDGNWQVTHGPFTAADFDRRTPWTLLVQSVDQYVPAVAALLDLVAFLPRWRMDDVMVSYAVEGGSVGPHYDFYDVFLLQGRGERSWRLGQHCDGSAPLRGGTELRILADFQQQAEYRLRPGDLLYVPPGVAHWGIGHGDCMTFSLGFRAPRLNDALSRWVDQALESLDPDLFYRDAGREPARRAGEICGRDLTRVREQALQLLQASQDARWFGELVTETDYTADPQESADISARIAAGPRAVRLRADARLAWHLMDDGLQVFANGVTLHADAAARATLELLCGERVLALSPLAAALGDGAQKMLLLQLAEMGCIDVE
jgi:50S ribosomal protein L16 3-hydroxylase